MLNSLSPLQEPLRIRPRRSNSLLCYLLLIHIIVLLATLYAARQVPLLQLLAALLLPAMFCYYYLAFYTMRLAQSVYGVAINGEQVTLRMVDGSSQQGLLGERHFVAPWLVVLAVALPDSRANRRIVLFPDAVREANLFRRLRVQLRFRQSRKARSSVV